MRGPKLHCDDRGPPWWKSIRYRIALIGFFGVANAFLQRNSLSMAIVCMVNHTAVDLLVKQESELSSPGTLAVSINGTRNYTLSVLNNNVDNSTSCSVLEGTAEKNEDGEYVWSRNVQGLLLGAMYWGYVCSQIIGAYIVRLFGLRKTLLPNMILMSILTLVTHPASMVSPWMLFVVRILMGFVNGVFMPGIFFVLEIWAPAEEKGRLSSLIFSGMMMSNVVVFPMSALLCDYGFAGGWPSIFYISGLCSLVMCVAWFFIVYDSPLKHPTIHPKERDYIMSHKVARKTSKSESLPWCKIFTSLPAISTICAQFALNWGFYLMLNTLPLYMREVLKFDIKSNGVFTMLPYLSMWLVLSISGYVGDKLVKKFSVNVVRKSSTVLGLLVPAMLLIGMSYLDCRSIPLAMSLLCLALGFMALNWIGVLVSFLDIAPKYAGTLMTVGNTIGMTTGLITPYMVAEFTKDKTREQWQKVFFLTAGVMCFGCFMHVLFSKGSVQKWAIGDEVRELEIEIMNEVSSETKTENQSHISTGINQS